MISGRTERRWKAKKTNLISATADVVCGISINRLDECSTTQLAFWLEIVIPVGNKTADQAHTISPFCAGHGTAITFHRLSLFCDVLVFP